MQIPESGLQDQESDEFNRYFFDALRSKAVGDEPNMLSSFRKCLSINPDHSVVNFEMAQYYISNKMASAAKPYLDKAVEGDPENYWVIRALWKWAVLDMNSSMERSALERLRDIQPDNPEYVWELAMVKLRAYDPDGAISDLNRLEELMGPSDAILDQKVSIYTESFRFNDAEMLLKDAIAKAPNRAELKGRLAQFYATTGRESEAFGVYEEVLKLEPNNPIANMAVGQYLSGIGKLDSAMGFFKVAFGNTALNIDAKIHVLASMIPVAERNPRLMMHAEALSDTLLFAHPSNPKAYAMRADVVIRLGKPVEARKLWKEAVFLPNGDKWELWQQIIQTDAGLHWWDSLHVDSKLLIERYPNQPAGYMYDGLALTRLSRDEEAVEILEEGQLYATGNPELEVQFWLQLADAYAGLDDAEMAEEYFDKAMELNDENPLVLNNYAWYLAVRGERLHEALAFIDRATHLSPHQYTYFDTYAWVLYQLDRYEQALVKIDSAISLGGESDAEVIEHKADILIGLDRSQEAISLYQTALRLGGNENRIREKIRKYE